MRFIGFGLAAAVAVAVGSGCHADACVWSVDRVRAESGATLSRDASPLVLESASFGVGAFRSLRTDERSTRYSGTVVVEGDPEITTLVLELDLGNPTAATSLDLASLGGSFRVVLDSTIVAEGVPTGTLTLEEFDARCEFSDTYGDSSSHWSCAANLDATLDATFATPTASYRVVGTLSQREEMSEACHECGGIEGCDY